MTVKELKDLLATIEDETEEIYVNDRYGYHSTELTLERHGWGVGYLIIEG